MHIMKLPVLTVLLLISALGAHPHIFIDANVDLLFDANGMKGVRNHWLFDELYSQAILATADVDKNGILSPQESKLVLRDVIQPLAQSDYFNHLVVGDAMTTNSGIVDFSAKIVSGRLVCDFTVPYDFPANREFRMMLLVVADPASYTLLTVDLDKAQVKAPAGLEVDYFVDPVSDISLFKGSPSQMRGLFFRFRKAGP